MSDDDLLDLIVDARDRTWMPQAACRGMNPDTFHPSRGESVRELKAICAECPVIDPCREYGISEKHGIWGGLSERERRTLRRDVAKGPREIRHGTQGGYDTHRKRGEDACDACKAARAQAVAISRQRRRENAA
jgi:WhiB family redox-sensing transcriptional regulator